MKNLTKRENLIIAEDNIAHLEKLKKEENVFQ